MASKVDSLLSTLRELERERESAMALLQRDIALGDRLSVGARRRRDAVDTLNRSITVLADRIDDERTNALADRLKTVSIAADDTPPTLTARSFDASRFVASITVLVEQLDRRIAAAGKEFFDAERKRAALADKIVDNDALVESLLRDAELVATRNALQREMERCGSLTKIRIDNVDEVAEVRRCVESIESARDAYLGRNSYVMLQLASLLTRQRESVLEQRATRRDAVGAVTSPLERRATDARVASTTVSSETASDSLSTLGWAVRGASALATVTASNLAMGVGMGGARAIRNVPGFVRFMSGEAYATYSAIAPPSHDAIEPADAAAIAEADRQELLRVEDVSSAKREQSAWTVRVDEADDAADDADTLNVIEDALDVERRRDDTTPGSELAAAVNAVIALPEPEVSQRRTGRTRRPVERFGF